MLRLTFWIVILFLSFLIVNLPALAGGVGRPLPLITSDIQ